MKFLLDNQLPPALARFIQSELGCPAIHVADVGLRDASDAEVWSFATNTQLILVLKDEDFANMVVQTPTAKPMGQSWQLPQVSLARSFPESLAATAALAREWQLGD